MPFSRQNGVDIWYEVAGQGPALVFIHANPFDHDLWMYQAAHFSTWFRVVGIDIRGYGRSAKVTTPYDLKHLRALVHPQFADSRLGRHLLNQFVEREPRLRGEAIAQVFMAGNHTDTTARLPSMKVPTLVINGEFDHS